MSDWFRKPKHLVFAPAHSPEAFLEPPYVIFYLQSIDYLGRSAPQCPKFLRGLAMIFHDFY